MCLQYQMGSRPLMKIITIVA